MLPWSPPPSLPRLVIVHIYRAGSGVKSQGTMALEQEGQDSAAKACVPLLPYTSMMCVGPTGCGKSFFLHRLLRQRHLMYSSNPPTSIIYCYGAFSPDYAALEKDIDGLVLHDGLPTEAYINGHSGPGLHCLIVLDDLMDQALNSPMVETIFTAGCHHKSLSIWVCCQNLNKQAKCARTVALNSTYLAIWRNLRDEMQIKMLGSRMGCGPMFREIYKDATCGKCYAYIFCDFSPHSDDETRFRTNIFPGEDTIIYVPKTQ